MELKSNKNSNERLELLKELVDIQNKFLNAEEKTLKFKERERIVDWRIGTRLHIYYDLISTFVRENLGSEYSVQYKTNYLGNTRFVIKVVDKKGKSYTLFNCDNDANLTMLYSDKYYKDWDILFKKDPGLKERIWNCVKLNVINRNKRQHLSYIQQMIAERNKEIKDLNTPEYIEQKIENLKQKNEEAKNELKQTAESINYVGF